MEPIVFDIYYVFKMASHAAYLFFFFVYVFTVNIL